MSNDIDLATALFGNKRLENGTTETVKMMTGTAVSNSADGKVKVIIDGTVTGEEYDGELQDNVIELDTNPNVKEGDVVQITAYGGVSNSMIVTGDIGSGDKASADTDDARKVATNYIDIDENKGITVGNMTDETLGKNTYIDANGVQIRDGETVLASFEEDKISLGKNSENSQISMCGDYGTISMTQIESSSLNGLTISSKKSVPIYLQCEKDTGTDTSKEKFYLSLDDSGLMFSGWGYSYEGETQVMKPYISVSMNQERMELRRPSKGTLENDLELDVEGRIEAEEVQVNGTNVSLQGHKHSTSDITSGTLAVARGGTGKTSGTFYGETVLFNNSSQSYSANVTLSSTCVGYTYLDVYAMSTDGDYLHTRVYNPVVGRTFDISVIHGSSPNAWSKFKRFKIASATSIQKDGSNGGEWILHSNSFNSGEFIKIIRVVGIK